MARIVRPGGCIAMRRLPRASSWPGRVWYAVEIIMVLPLEIAIADRWGTD
jgi:hypothetical protein